MIVRPLTTVAPDLDADMITDEADLCYDLELDSMGHLNLLVSIAEQTGVDVPERDDARLVTVGDCVGYLESKGPGRAATPERTAGDAIS